MKGKRYIKDKKTQKEKKEKTFKFKNFIILILLLLLLILVCFLFIEKDNIFNKKVTAMTEVEKIIKVETVENADYLEITDLDVVSKDGYSTVSTTIKNTSNETITNLNLDICIYDKDNNLVSQLTNPIDSLAPNETVNSFGIVYTELLDDYICIIKKN